MWFAKLFGGRQDDDSEPSEFPPHPAANTPKPAQTAVRPSPQHESSLQPKQKGRPAKGFDPYNSGEFDKHKAWERVIR
jgi:hypothetical protein